MKTKIGPSFSRQKEGFVQSLFRWYDQHHRSYPWIGERDPYKVWLSEIILQQTRVEQGLPYYQRITAHFPTVSDLAEAEEQTVFRLWQGLGYYNRCKNMHKTAKIVCEQYDGQFPKEYDDLLQLPGIGPYTAAAIASFAFGLPYAVVDGNVERLLARYFGITEVVNTSVGKKTFTRLANELLNQKQPGLHNQAMMDFGATVCLPRQPICSTCPFRSNCQAYQNDLIQHLPVKKAKRPTKKRFFHYFIFRTEDRIFIRKRTNNDIWENLHEFFLYESQQTLTLKTLLETSVFKEVTKRNSICKSRYSPLFLHSLTHQRLYLHFVEVFLSRSPILPDDFFSIKIEEADQFAFPRPLVKYLASMAP